MSGFTVRPQPPRVLAAGNEPTCGESPEENARGFYCERPKGHAGAHKSESHSRYWPAEESVTA